MNKTKVLLALLIVLVFLLGLFAGARIFYHEDERARANTSQTSVTAAVSSEVSAEAGDGSTQYLLNFLEEKLAEVQLVNASSTLRFVPELSGDPKDKNLQKAAAETLYRLAEPDWDIINQAEVQTLVQSLLTVRINKTLGVQSDLKVYGLEPAAARVIYRMSDGRRQVLLVGKRLPDGKQTYAALEGSSEVYVAGNLADRAERGLLSLLSKSLTTLDNQSIKHFSLNRAADQVQFSFSVLTQKMAERPAESPALPSPSPSPTPAPQPLESRQWELSAPLNWPARSGDLNSMVSELSSLLPVEYVTASDRELGRYGLDHPAYLVSLQSDYDKILLEIGAPAGDHLRYARLDRYPLIFTLNMDSLSMIDRPLLELCSPHIANLDISLVSALTLTYEEGQIDVSLNVPSREEREKNPELKEYFTVNGEDADVRSTANEHYFKQFYRSLIALQIDGIDLTTPADDAAEFKIVYTLKDKSLAAAQAKREGKEERIELALAPRDNTTDFVFLDGQYTGFFIKKSQLEQNKNGLNGFYQTWPRLLAAIKNNVEGIYDWPRD